MFIAQIVFWIVALTLLGFSLAPLSKIRFGAVRGLAFPRMQFFLLAVALWLAALVLFGGNWRMAALIVTGASALVQVAYIIKFTPIWPKQSLAAKDPVDGRARVSMLTANVKKSNRAYHRLVDLVKAEDPDLVMAIEVDRDWVDALQDAFGGTYPHWVNVPQENGYGMSLFSRLPLEEAEVREIITDGVPSIRAGVALPGGGKFRLYVVHPEPPVIDHDTKGRDSEIALIGIEAKKDPLPAVVSGDLNDVAWSTVTRQFQRLSGLLDPRVGRGFYNTFNAFYFFARWPLDHLFHDARFRLIDMARLDKIGSDHFPMRFDLCLVTHPGQGIDPGRSDVEEAQEIADMIRDEKARSRRAIGENWEDEA